MRVKRRVESSEQLPAVGARIVLETLRMQVSAPLSQEGWQWLLLQGWRECRYRNDRRQYIEIPKDAYERLRFASPRQRERFHRRILALAARQQAA